MKSMKKLIAISLVVVMLFALAVPAFAWGWSGSNTTNLIESAGEEIVVNAGKLPDNTTITLNGEASDENWKYAYPFTLNKKYTPGGYSNDADMDVFMMYDSEYLYIKEVRRHMSTTDASKYFILASDVDLATDKFTPVGVYLTVTPKFDESNAVVASTVAGNIMGYKYISGYSSGTGDLRSYLSTPTGMEGYTRKVNASCFEIETKIPWSQVGSGVTPTENMLLGFEYYVQWDGSSASYLINSLPGSNYHNEWDHFAPLYLRGVDEKAAEQVIDTTWYDASKTEFTLTKVGQLRGLALLAGSVGGNTTDGVTPVSSVTADKTFKLGADMDLNPGWDNTSNTDPLYTWTPMGGFSGTFDGQGYTISNMICDPVWNVSAMTNKWCDSWQRDMGFISHAYGDVTVKDVIFANSKVLSNYNAGGVIGVAWDGANVTVSNVYADIDVHAEIGTNGYSYASVIVGKFAGNNSVSMENIVCAGDLSINADSSITTYNCAPVWGSGTNTTVASKVDDILVTGKMTYPAAIAASTRAFTNGGARSENNVVTFNGDTGALTGPNKGNPEVVDGVRVYTSTQYPAHWVNVDEDAKAGETFVKMPPEVAAMVGRNLWIQRSEKVAEATSFEVRVLTVVDSAEWEKFGWKVEIDIGNTGTFTDLKDLGFPVEPTTTVYKSVTAAGATKTATELGGKYIAAVAFSSLPETGSFSLRITPIYYGANDAAYTARSSVAVYTNGVLQ